MTAGLTVAFAHPGATVVPVAAAPTGSTVVAAAADSPRGQVALWHRAADAAKPAPAPAVVAPPPASTPPTVSVPAPPPVTYHDRLLSSAFGLNAGVVVYSDCSGRTPLTRTAAAIDTCISGRTFFVGHNPGVFTPLMAMSVGAHLTWYDAAGAAHQLRIVNIQSWDHSGYPPAAVAGATFQFQTCITSDGSVDRILDAAPA